jgi:hypothetical protein
MKPIKPYVLASAVLCALITGACTKPQVQVDVKPKQLSSAGLVEVTWKTQDFETTTLSSNPVLSGLPKTMTGNANGVDKFQVTTTTTFELKGQTAPNFSKIASSTVTVGPGGTIR